MKSTNLIHVVSCHAEGEVGDVIVGGVKPPPGKSILNQSRWIEKDGKLRGFVLNEPRGGVFRHVNLLVPPIHPEAATGWIIMEPEEILRCPAPIPSASALCFWKPESCL